MAKKIRKMRYKILPLTITMPFGDTQNTIHPTLLWDQQNIILVDGGGHQFLDKARFLPNTKDELVSPTTGNNRANGETSVAG